MNAKQKPNTIPLWLMQLTALACLAILAGALWTQRQGYAPCPLCILQRLAYLCVLVLAILGAALMRGGAGTAAKTAAGAALLACLAGLGVAARHVWLVLHPGQTCGLDPLAATINHWTISQWFPWMFRADGLCADTPYILGQSLPVWSALGFAVLAVLLAAAILKLSAR